MSRRAAPPAPNPLDRKTLESAMTADLTPSPTSRPARGGPALLIGLAALLAASIASAHVTVSPKRSAPGERETYVIRAPNERRTATVRIEGEFPPEVKVTSFEAKPGWTIEPKRNADGAIVGATWTGSLLPDAFAEFRIIAANPPVAGTVVWKFVQTYADGEVVNWAGPKGSKTPAPQVEVIAPAP